MKNVFLAAIFVILLFGCVNQYQPESNSSSIITTPNDTTPTYGKLPSDYSIQTGDHVWVTYTLWVDGKVYDTNNETQAKESGIYNSQRTYKPLDFDVALDKGLIQGFILNIVGMQVNETLQFNVPPQLGYGNHDPTKVLEVPRYLEQPLYETAPLSYFQALGRNISNGSLISENPMVIVSDINDENVTLFYALTGGQQFTKNGLTRKVISVNDTYATLELMLQNGTTYNIPNPQTGATTQFTVIDVSNTSITLDMNHPLAGKNLSFHVTVLKIQHNNLLSE
ncbi:Putative FKBP-type peptidyl-prolyl cis-trans isomerase [Candidatus Bilamarchaeum dharawalense]|uniref:Peptidyl-prolyl cis-trans isomerase n=1 Tax=Candidatus Bilamarchaeum dharawalense TaxID=2885759 RepID=A0A5E4LP36_9ARCH|nr:Putative FKBP-type peptidyl-prolyl cis-trans isomerase [Candidatus Bilamarchaeum dharawalense]